MTDYFNAAARALWTAQVHLCSVVFVGGETPPSTFDERALFSGRLDPAALRGVRVEITSFWIIDADGIATCLGLQAEPNVDMEAIVKVIEAKLSADTTFPLT